MSSPLPSCYPSPPSTRAATRRPSPRFGSERTGAPVVAFCRFDDTPIRTREPIAEPDALIVQDPTLLHQVDLFSGLKPGGYVLINSGRSFDELGLGEFARALPRRAAADACPRPSCAREHLGRPLPNAALLGGFAALTRPAAARRRSPRRSASASPARSGEGNAAAAEACFELVAARAARGGRMLKQIEGSRRGRRDGRAAAAPRSSAPTRSRLRRTSSRASPTSSAPASLAPCEYVTVESEFAAISVCIGASAAGARAYTATASQGLLYMAEALYNASGLGLPIVMTVANRAIGAPINIWNDHSDSMSQRDCGLDPALRRDQPGGRRPARAGVPDRRAALAAGDGLHGRLRPHPRRTSRSTCPTQEQVDAFLPPSSRARCSTRPTR